MGRPQKEENVANINKEENLAAWKSVTTYDERRETASTVLLTQEVAWNVREMDKRIYCGRMPGGVGDQ